MGREWVILYIGEVLASNFEQYGERRRRFSGAYCGEIKEEIERRETKLLVVSQARLRRILNRGQRPAEGVNSR